MADMTREEAASVLWWASKQHYPGDQMDIKEYVIEAFDMAIAALREKQQRERGWGCAYCVIGRRSPDARYCSNCGRKLTPALPELANESEEVNPDSHQYVDNDSTNRRKSVKQKCRNLHSETAETCTLRCDYCGKYAKESDLTTEYTKDKYLICRRCKENA
jgi:hypothetical protein